jgi:hypothetical protein
MEVLRNLWSLLRMVYRRLRAGPVRPPLPLGIGGRFVVLQDRADNMVIRQNRNAKSVCGGASPPILSVTTTARKPPWLTRMIGKALPNTPLDGIRPSDLGMPFLVLHDDRNRQYFFGAADRICLPCGSS